MMLRIRLLTVQRDGRLHLKVVRTFSLGTRDQIEDLYHSPLSRELKRKLLEAVLTCGVGREIIETRQTK
jgi:hypothetical protein